MGAMAPAMTPGARKNPWSWYAALFYLCFLALTSCRYGRRNEVVVGAQSVFALAKDIEAVLIKDMDADRNFQELLPAYRQKLKPFLKGDWGQQCNDNCLKTLFEAVDYVSFFSHGQVADPELPDMMRTIFMKLKASGLASERHAQKVRKSLIKFRRFDEAREFSLAERLEDEEIPPLKVPASLPPVHRVIEYAVDGRSLSVRAGSLSKTAVLIIASPTCQFSNAALKEIETDAELSRALVPKLTIITPPSGIIEAAAFAEWNRQHPQFLQVQAFGDQDWPEVADWENTPGFYFIAEGKIIAYTWGWGPNALDGIKSNLRKLEAGLGR